MSMPLLFPWARWPPMAAWAWVPPACTAQVMGHPAHTAALTDLCTVPTAQALMVRAWATRATRATRAEWEDMVVDMVACLMDGIIK